MVVQKSTQTRVVLENDSYKVNPYNLSYRNDVTLKKIKPVGRGECRRVPFRLKFRYDSMQQYAKWCL